VLPLTVIEQVPPLNVQLPSAVAPSLKFTVPAGTVFVMVVSVTVAVKLVEEVLGMVDGFAVTAVLVASAAIVMICVAEYRFVVGVVRVSA
jgi:hypothetical protein